ncbi:hypothetical protein N2W54_002269 [Lotmaria passim]
MSRLCFRARSLAPLHGPAFRVAQSVPNHPLHVSCRLFVTTTFVCRAGKDGVEGAARPVAADESGGFDSIGQRLFSLHEFHRKALLDMNVNPADYQYVAHDAWDLLQSIPDEEVERLSTRNVAEIVHCYHYFSLFWENGMEGPAKTSSSRAGQGPGVAEGAEESAMFHYPLVDRNDASVRGDAVDSSAVQTPAALHKWEAPPKRANPLDEILDF